MTDDIEVAGLLRKVRTRIAAPESWTQKMMARDKESIPAYVDSEDAVCWRLMGAIHLEAGDEDLSIAAVCALDDLLDFFCEAYNDDPNTTHSDIIALLDRAIAKLEAANV